MTARLFGSMKANWTMFNGWSLSSGAGRPMNLSDADLCDLIEYWIFRNVTDEATRLKIENQLWMPPPEIPLAEVEVGPWSDEALMAQFSSQLEQLTTDA